MSSPSRRVGLRKRLWIAAKSVAIGGSVAAVTPYIMYLGYLSDAKSGRKPSRLIDWQRLAQVVKDSNVFEDLATELVVMLPKIKEESGGGDYVDEPTFH